MPTFLVACSSALLLSLFGKITHGAAPFGVSDQFPNDSTQNIETRLETYRQANIEIIRADVEWRALETKSGTWRDPQTLNFLNTAKRAGFTLKLCVGSMQGPPQWYFDLHPEAQLKNSRGLRSSNVISYWYPDLRKLLDEKDHKLFLYLSQQELLNAIGYIIVPLGPACEGIYPVPWTTIEPNMPMDFWFYDRNAAFQFSKQMNAKYKSLERANAAWGTSYKTWEQVSLALTPVYPKVLWKDVLDWYRDEKRAFVIWQVEHYKRLLLEFFPEKRRPRLILLIPGSHRTVYDYTQALESRESNYATKAMIDTDFTLDLAWRLGADVQYTGLPNLPELEYIQAYQSSHHYKLRVWGENAGNQGTPCELDKEVLINRLFGQEYIGSDLFEADHVTKTSQMQMLSSAHSWLVGQWARHEDEMINLSEVTIVQGGCIFSGADGRVGLCLQLDGSLTLSINGKRSRVTNTERLGHCPKNEEPNRICTAKFQTDGNFVIRMGDDVLWSSGTQHRGSQLVLSSRPPHLQIVDVLGEPIWKAI